MTTILHVIQQLNLGGAARALIAASKYSSRLGAFQHRVISLLPSGADALELARAGGLTVCDVPDRPTILREMDSADIVQIHWWNTPQLQSLLRDELPAARLLLWYHVAGDGSPQIITPELVNLADLNIATNPWTYSDLPVFRDLPSAEREKRVAMIIDPTDFERLHGIQLRPHAGFNVGYIGTVDSFKMHPRYVPMSAGIQVPDAHFVVCGPGNLEQLQAQTRDLGAADRFDFRGYVNDIKPVIETFDVYGYPLCESTYASGELNLQEVMYAGVPPVVFPYGGVKQLVQHDFTGLVVRSEHEYQQAIEHLYHNSIDRIRLGRNAAEYARQNFGAENAAHKLNPLYERVLGQPKRRRCWRMKAGVSLLDQPVLVQDLQPESSEPCGAELFVESLGSHGHDFEISLTSQQLEKLFAAEVNISTASRLVHYTGVGAYLARYPNDRFLRLWSGLGHLHTGCYEKACEDFRAAIQNGGTHWRFHWYSAQAAERVNPPWATEAARNVLKVVPDFTEAADLLRRLGAELLPATPKSSPAGSTGALTPSAAECLEWADGHLGEGRLNQARDWLERALDFAPDESELLVALGNLEFQLGHFEPAYQALSKAATQRPADPLLHVLIAHAALRLEKTEAFEAALGHALQLDPEHAEALRLLSDLNRQQGRHADAARGYTRILARKPDDIDALLALGKCLFECEQFEAACSAFEEVLKLNPQHTLATQDLEAIHAKQEGQRKEPSPSSPASALDAKSDRRTLVDSVASPLISVIVSAYAAEKYIRACLEDLEAQTIADKLEIIVIDSGSPQNERAIVEEFQQSYNNISYHRTERETLYAAWNRAIGLARGKYVANANCDDAHRPDAIEKLVAALEAHPEADLAYGDYYTTTVPNGSFANPSILRHVVHPSYHPATVMMYCVTGCHPMWRKTVFDKLGLFDSTYTAPGDYEFLFRFVQAGLRAVRVPQPLSLFFQNAEGLSWKSAAQTKREGDRILGKYRSQMPIERLFKVDPSDAASVSQAWVALGNLAMQHEMPWLSNFVQDLPYARFCFEQALKADSRNVSAGKNLVITRMLQQKSPGDLGFLEHFPVEMAKALRRDIKRGQLQLAPAVMPPAVEPIEFGEQAVTRVVPSGAVLPLFVEEGLGDGEQTLSPRPNLSIRLAGSFLNHGRQASDALNLALPLASRINLATLDQSEPYSYSFDVNLPDAVRAALRATQFKFNFCLGGIGISHRAVDELNRVQGVNYHIGRTMFEADRLPMDWVRACNQMDELWVPSRFNAELFANSGVERDKLVVIPGAVNPREFDPAKHTPLPLPNRAAFNFLAVFEWCTRKGWDVLIASYLREFSVDDDVCLYLRTNLSRKSEAQARAAIEEQIRKFTTALNLGDKKLPRVEILTAEIPMAEMPKIYRAADCVVAPSRGEAWGRVAHEAMMMALPVIATNWGGHTHFMNAETAYPLDYELAPATNLELDQWQYHGQRWANPSETHLRELLRHVQRSPDEARAKGAKARAHVQTHFSSEAVADQIVARLQIIQEKLTKPSCPPGKTRDAAIPQSAIGNRQSLNVALEGSFLDFGSLSHVNRELTRQLARQPKLSLTCVSKNVVPPELAKHKLLVDTARRLKYPAPKNSQVTIRHAWPPNWERPASGAWVLIQPWEFGVLPEEWTIRLGSVDEVWVYSDYVRRVYVDSGVDPAKVKIVPLGIDPEKFKPGLQPLKLATAKSFKFLFVGGTIHRKGPDLLLKAYLENFTAADDVCLVIKDFGCQSVYAGQTFESQIRAAQAQPKAPEILYLNEELAPEALPGLYAACDCLVHPYRGEGFGLPVLEAMACGLPVVVTGGGSTDDFATDEVAYRIPSLKKEFGSAVSGLKLVRDGWLLEPDLAALAARMKWVVANRDETRTTGRAASELVRCEWTWERAAQIAAQRIQGLIARRGAKSGEAPERSSKPITLPPVAKIGHLGEARELFRQGKLVPAWNKTVATLNVRPFHPEAFLLLGEIAQTAGHSKQAKEFAEHARTLAPKWKPAQQFLKSTSSKGQVEVELPALPLSLYTTHGTSRLTVCLITKNEKRFLGKCLESVRDLAWQIVVVDTGSTDGTCDIAVRYGAELHLFDWCDDFSAARNAALERAVGDWVLFLDADEELLPGQRDALLQAMQDSGAIAYRLPMIDEGREDEGVSYVPRLFRNAPGLFHVGRVHEQVFTSVEVRRAEWGLENKLSTVQLLHHGYTKDMVKSRDKIARNLRLLQKALEEMPGEANLLMNLGLELVNAGRFHGGLEQYEAAFRAMSALRAEEVIPELRETLLTQFCTHLLTVKNYAEIARVQRSPLAKAGGLSASLHWLFGLACIESKNFVEGAEQMRQCLAKRNKAALSPVNKNILKAGPSHCLAACLTALKQTAAADKAFRAAVEADPSSSVVQFDYARFLAENGHEVEALKWVHQLSNSDPFDAMIWQFGGHVALSKPAFLEFACDWTSEAAKLFPAHGGIAQQRAQALLLNGQPDGALPLWKQFGVASNPSHRAALIICETLLNQPLEPAPAEMAERVEQEFVTWYRRLLAANAGKVIQALNQRTELLRRVVPAAVHMLETARAEANAVSVP